MKQDELDEEYNELYLHGQTMSGPIYALIAYTCCLSNVFRLKQAHNLMIFLVHKKSTTGKEISEHLIRLINVNPASQQRLDIPKFLNNYSYTMEDSEAG